MKQTRGNDHVELSKNPAKSFLRRNCENAFQINDLIAVEFLSIRVALAEHYVTVKTTGSWPKLFQGHSRGFICLKFILHSKYTRGLPFFEGRGYEDFSENLHIFRTPPKKNFSKIFCTPQEPSYTLTLKKMEDPQYIQYQTFFLNPSYIKIMIGLQKMKAGNFTFRVCQRYIPTIQTNDRYGLRFTTL